MHLPDIWIPILQAQMHLCNNGDKYQWQNYIKSTKVTKYNEYEPLSYVHS